MKYNTRLKEENQCKTARKHKTIQYMGSKRSLLNFIESSLNDFLNNVVEDYTCNSLFDAFSGSGQVSNHFKNTFKVITNDKQFFTKVINDTYLCSTADKNKLSELIHRLNTLPEFYFNETDGWFTKNYSKGFDDGSAIDKDGNRKPWLTKNAKQIDMIRTLIDVWFDSGSINKDDKNVLLVSLMLAVNKVSNCLGHQNGYLKSWDKKSCNDLILELPEFESEHNFQHQNYCGDVFDTLKKVKSDITYFDPPYGSNNETVSCSVRYSSFYHLWNTLTENSRPDVFGKASKPLSTKGYTEPLEKNNKAAVMPKFIRLIEESNTKYVCFSYSNKSLLTAEDFEEVYRLAGCDMSTFRIYQTSHKSNSQKKSALKNGEYINRKNHDDELFEFFIIAKKKPFHIRISDKNSGKGLEKIVMVDDWIKANASSYSTEDKDYSIVFDKQKNTSLKSMNDDEFVQVTESKLYKTEPLTAAGSCLTREIIMNIKIAEEIEFKKDELTFLRLPTDLRVPELFFAKEDVSSIENNGVRTFNVCVKPKKIADKVYLENNCFIINIEINVKTNEWINTYEPIGYSWFQGGDACDIENIPYGNSLYRILVLKHHTLGNELSFYDDIDTMIEEFFLYLDCYVDYALAENIKIVDELNAYFFEIKNIIYQSIIEDGYMQTNEKNNTGEIK